MFLTRFWIAVALKVLVLRDQHQRGLDSTACLHVMNRNLKESTALGIYLGGMAYAPRRTLYQHRLWDWYVCWTTSVAVNIPQLSLINHAEGMLKIAITASCLDRWVFVGLCQSAINDRRLLRHLFHAYVLTTLLAGGFLRYWKPV